VVCRHLQQNLPDIPIVAEESADRLRTPSGRMLLDRIRHFLPEWTVDEILEAIAIGTADPGGQFITLDPIDGTKGFLRGDNYAVAAGLIVDGQVRLGALCCPNVVAPESEPAGVVCFSDSSGHAWAQSLSGGMPTRVSVQTAHLDRQVRFLESVESGHANHSMQGRIVAAFGDRAQSVRVDSQAKYAMLAMGAADVYLRLPKAGKEDYQEKIWDHAAGAHIVACAGGTVTDMTGAPLDFGCGRRLERNRGVIATCGPIHQEIIDLVAKATA